MEGVEIPSEIKTEEDFIQFRESLGDVDEEIESKVRDKASKTMKKEMMPSLREGATYVLGDDETTKEYIEDIKEDFVGGAVLGAFESIPAIIAPSGKIGFAIRMLNMGALVEDALMKEMEGNPEFANISENEKQLLTLPITIVSGALESFGISNIINKTGLINSLTMAVLKKSGKRVTASSFKEVLDKEIKNRIAKGVLVVGSAAATEFETGGLQEMVDIWGKSIYNEIKGKEFFDTPDTWSAEFGKQVLMGAAQEAIGGFVLGVPGAISTAFKSGDLSKLDNETFELFQQIRKDPEYNKGFITNIKNQINAGEITEADGQAQIDTYNNVKNILSKL